MTVKEGKEIVYNIVDNFIFTGNEVKITKMNVEDETLIIDMTVYKKPDIKEISISIDNLRNGITKDYENN